MSKMKSLVVLMTAFGAWNAHADAYTGAIRAVCVAKAGVGASYGECLANARYSAGAYANALANIQGVLPTLPYHAQKRAYAIDSLDILGASIDAQLGLLGKVVSLLPSDLADASKAVHEAREAANRYDYAELTAKSAEAEAKLNAFQRNL